MPSPELVAIARRLAREAAAELASLAALTLFLATVLLWAAIIAASL